MAVKIAVWRVSPKSPIGVQLGWGDCEGRSIWFTSFSYSFSDPWCPTNGGIVILEATARCFVEGWRWSLGTRGTRPPHCRGQASRPVPFCWCTPHIHLPACQNYGDSSDHNTFFHVSVCMVYALLNDQMCIHLCNLFSFCHCNPTIISIFSTCCPCWHSLIPFCIGGLSHLRKNCSSVFPYKHQMGAVDHNRWAYLLTSVPYFLNANVTLVSVTIETLAC